MALVVLLASGAALAYGGGRDYNTVRCQGGKCTGTPKDDDMRGTLKRDVMYAFKGHDKLYGRAAKDSLFGFDGNDILWGGDGPDSLGGGYGGDKLYGQEGNDELAPGPDDDANLNVLNGGGGDDRLKWGPAKVVYSFYPGWGDDTLSGSDSAPAGYTVDFYQEYGPAVKEDLQIDLNPGPDPEVTDGTNTVEWLDPKINHVDGGSGNDTITGNDLPNSLWGNDGRDVINAGGGDDRLDGGCSADNRLNGGEGNDIFVADCGNNTLMEGGPGDDRMVAWPFSAGAEIMEGGPDNDYLDPSRGTDTVRGGDGNDRIVANDISDKYWGEGDSVEGGTGDDTIEAEDESQDTVDCGDGNDTVSFDEGIDTVTNCETQNSG